MTVICESTHKSDHETLILSNQDQNSINNKLQQFKDELTKNGKNRNKVDVISSNDFSGANKTEGNNRTVVDGRIGY